MTRFFAGPGGSVIDSETGICLLVINLKEISVYEGANLSDKLLEVLNTKPLPVATH
jgi:hypothetical protein